MSDRAPTRANSTTSRIPTAEQVRAWAAEGTIPVPWIVGTLVMLFPVGLFFVWQRPQWATKTKWIWTGGSAAAFAVGMWLVAPLLIFLTLLGAFAVAILAIWSSSTLALDKKKLATGGAVGGLLLCLFAEFAFFSIRAEDAEKEVKRKKYAEQAVLDKEKARLKEEAVRQKLTEGNQAWSSGDKVKAVALYRECIEMGLSQGSEASSAHQRVIEHDVSEGNLSSAKALMRKARGWNKVELAFTDPKCNELLKEVETQVAEEKRAEAERLTEDFFPRKDGASWDYVHEMTSDVGVVRVRIQYEFNGKSEIKEYAKRVEIVRGGNATPAPLGVERTCKETFTGTTAVKREGKLLLVKGGKEGGWEPWLKIDARVGESWDGEKTGNIQIRYQYKERGTHKGIETVTIVEEMSVNGTVENRVERLFAKNIGLLSAESSHEKAGSRYVTYRLVIDGFDRIDRYLPASGNNNLTTKEKLFFK